MKAVIPAAGLGTRFGAATKAQPKEMLPVWGKPIIQYVVEEAAISGIENILIITNGRKRAIEDHFDRNFELEIALEKSGKMKELKMVREISDMARITYVRQQEQKGLGDAVSYAEAFVGNEPFALLLGDTITVPSCTEQLLRGFENHGKSIVAVERVPREKISRYGIVDAYQDGRIRSLVEKPKPEDAPSNLAILGRYILEPDIFDCIKETAPGYGGEIQLTDAMKILLKKRDIYASEYKGKRYDIGNNTDLLKSSIELALAGEQGEELKKYLRGLSF
ncbi:UTP--glucose-1-phosphate uridylyltransferase [archaeon]|nr:MAG: UTP--glucose-1-phosphate uridylyltransferase [archaeon]